MMARAAVALLALGSVVGAEASESQFCDALRAIEEQVRHDFADDSSASVDPPDQALKLLIGTELTGFGSNGCGTPKFEVLETPDVQTYSWDVMALNLHFVVENGFVSETFVRSKP